MSGGPPSRRNLVPAPRTRTWDLPLTGRLLCRLSYTGKSDKKAAAPLPYRATATARQWRATGAAPLAKSGRSRCQTASSGARGECVAASVLMASGDRGFMAACLAMRVMSVARAAAHAGEPSRSSVRLGGLRSSCGPSRSLLPVGGGCCPPPVIPVVVTLVGPARSIGSPASARACPAAHPVDRTTRHWRRFARGYMCLDGASGSSCRRRRVRRQGRAYDRVYAGNQDEARMTRAAVDDNSFSGTRQKVRLTDLTNAFDQQNCWLQAIKPILIAEKQRVGA